MTARVLLAALSVLAVGVCGCGRSGGGAAQVKGALVANGQPLAIAEGDDVQLLLEPADSKSGTSHPLDLRRADASFASLKEGVPPGKYRVVVQVAPYGTSKDRFQGVFAAGKSPLAYEVTGDRRQAITVDVGAQTVTRR